jgi:hypothetical protein
VSIERIFYCDAEDCNAHTRTIHKRPGMSFLVVAEDDGRTLHFCGWDCAMKYAAAQPPIEVIPVGDL